jgi:hypothetical protein
MQILSKNPPDVQARILEGVLARFPVGLSELRTEERANQIQARIVRLRSTAPVPSPSPTISSAVVERALNDAEQLIQSSGATSGVDRAHTAFHGYLLAVCEKAKLQHSRDAGIIELLSSIRDNHPRFRDSGPRSEDVRKILRAMSAIVDALNPIRNRASVAHPNTELLDAPEAMLAINAIRTLLHYLDSRLTLT